MTKMYVLYLHKWYEQSKPELILASENNERVKERREEIIQSILDFDTKYQEWSRIKNKILYDWLDEQPLSIYKWRYLSLEAKKNQILSSGCYDIDGLSHYLDFSEAKTPLPSIPDSFYYPPRPKYYHDINSKYGNCLLIEEVTLI